MSERYIINDSTILVTMKTKPLFTVVVYNQLINVILHFDFKPTSQDIYDACVAMQPGHNLTSTTATHYIQETVVFLKDES